MDLIPDFSDIDFYKQQLKETFNHDYEKIYKIVWICC
jgi:hypothetical protein